MANLGGYRKLKETLKLIFKDIEKCNCRGTLGKCESGGTSGSDPAGGTVGREHVASPLVTE